MKALYFDVHGTPAPQGSKRAVVHRSTGRAVVMESSKRVRPWRDAVRSDAVQAMREQGCERFAGPVRVSMVFWFDRPRSHYGTGRNAGMLKSGAPEAPAGPPDLSKLIRSTEDALTDAGVWEDDARVVEVEASKRYVSVAQRMVGASIRVAEVLGG